eukprot:g83003.t1
MGEPNEIAEGVGAINLAGGGFWKTWGEVEEKAPTENKNPRLVRLKTEKMSVQSLQRAGSQYCSTNNKTSLFLYAVSKFPSSCLFREQFYNLTQARDHICWARSSGGSSQIV